MIIGSSSSLRNFTHCTAESARWSNCPGKNSTLKTFEPEVCSKFSTYKISTGGSEKTVLQAVSKLRDRECLIMELRFGLNGRKEHTQKQVADKLGISQSYISRLEKKIIRQLKIELDKAV